MLDTVENSCLVVVVMLLKEKIIKVKSAWQAQPRGLVGKALVLYVEDPGLSPGPVNFLASFVIYKKILKI